MISSLPLYLLSVAVSGVHYVRYIVALATPDRRLCRPAIFTNVIKMPTPPPMELARRSLTSNIPNFVIFCVTSIARDVAMQIISVLNAILVRCVLLFDAAAASFTCEESPSVITSLPSVEPRSVESLHKKWR